MLEGGLVSITFRDLSAKQIVTLVKKTDLTSIEWGGDVHVPHGDLEQAKYVRRLMQENGLKNTSYGSYYRVGESEHEGLDFSSVLETAKELEVPTIRVWAGRRGSDQADEQYWQTVIDDSRRIADSALGDGISVSYEFHGGTLTDTNESARKLLDEVNHPNCFTYWQPPNNTTVEYRKNGLEAVLEDVTNLHVFYWTFPDGQKDRRPLAEGEEEWRTYLDYFRESEDLHYAFLEFVRDGDQEQFLEDAATLAKLIQ